MNNQKLTFAMIALIAVTFSNSVHARVFHGKDRQSGEEISRVSVDTEQSGSSVAIGIKVKRNHKDNKVTLAFTSLDKALLNLDASSAKLIIDEFVVPLVFDRKGQNKALFMLSEMWFHELDRAVILKILHAKEMSIEISSPSGVVMSGSVSANSLSEIREVVSE